MGSTGNFPQEVFDTIGKPVHVSRRTIDLDAIKSALADGGLNGHVPFSAIYAGCALIQAVLVGKNQVFASNEASADEANITVDGFEVNHQFSKTYKVELALQDYIHTNIAPDLQYGSIMRPLSELKIAELFAKHAWNKYYKIFSSCNLANYKQGEDGGKLRWDGTCPKCVNAFLIFAPFVDRHELLEMFEGKNLSKDPELLEIYRQLLGLSDIKPFECVGTFDEMQLAYAMSVKNSDEYQVQGIGVVSEDFDYRHLGPYQPLFNEFLDYSNL